MKRRFCIINYFDVWYDAEGGYTVNNQCREETLPVFLDTTGTSDPFALEIQQELKRVKLFKKFVNRRLWRIDWNCSDADNYEIEASNGCPLFRLVAWPEESSDTRLKDAVKVLEWYADPVNWKDQETGIGMFPCEALQDCGEKARSFIKKE